MNSASLADVAVSVVQWQIGGLTSIGMTCAAAAAGVLIGCVWMIVKESRRRGVRS